MKIAFRADANKTIGMGHIMRCLSIADAFRALGHDILFIISDHGITSLINMRGYEAIVLNSDYKNMGQELPYWPSKTPNLIIIDSYYVTSQYLKQLHKKIARTGGKIVYLDDVYSFPYPVDVLVNYNAYATNDIYKKLYNGTDVSLPKLILGPRYAPLRTMFSGIAHKVQPEKVQNILISTGGSDELHLSLSLLRYIINNRGVTNKEDESKFFYHILLGVMNADKEEIKQLAKGKHFAVLHENVTDMKSLIEKMDLAISAAGSTLYEICACGVPLITLATADNQIRGAEAFERIGMGVNIGDVRDPKTIVHECIVSGSLNALAPQKIIAAVEKLASDYEKRVLMGTKMQNMIDGYGANRLVNDILKDANTCFDM